MLHKTVDWWNSKLKSLNSMSACLYTQHHPYMKKPPELTFRTIGKHEADETLYLRLRTSRLHIKEPVIPISI